MEKYTYLLINLGSILIPFIFSFHPKFKFNEKWKSTIFSLLTIAIIFISWDFYYTEMGVWGFNPNYLIGFKIFNLPVEEILFFICIPYACLFTYHCFKVLIPPFKIPYYKIVITFLILLLMSFGFVFIHNWYTAVTFLSLSLILIYFQFILSANWLARFYFTILFLILPFFIVNGILTGTGIHSEVVWYNDSEIIGTRLLTIPIEDFAYGFLLLILNVHVFENYNYLNKSNKLNLS
jgi:lycopene cyclase domain-containing protein